MKPKKLFKKLIDKLLKVCYNKYVKKNKISHFKKGWYHTMEKKITKREVLTAMLEVQAMQENADFVAYIENELQLLAKKSENRKSAKTNEENLKLADVVLDVLQGSEGMTASEIIRANDQLSGLSTPKMTALLKVLMEQGKVVRIEEKKRVIFKAVEVAE